MFTFYLEKYSICSAIGPKVNAGKKDSAAISRITARVINPKVAVSVFSVPELSGIYFFCANSPAIATGPIIGMNLDSNSTIPVEIFHQGVLSPSPSNQEPLFAAEEVNS